LICILFGTTGRQTLTLRRGGKKNRELSDNLVAEVSFELIESLTNLQEL
jgi:hypothetical protein